jgi:hypothetical protein
MPLELWLPIQGMSQPVDDILLGISHPLCEAANNEAPLRSQHGTRAFWLVVILRIVRQANTEGL